MTSKTNGPNLQIGEIYQGGMIFQLDESAEQGLIISIEDLDNSSWFHAEKICGNHSNENYNDWRLPTIEELRVIYKIKISLIIFKIICIVSNVSINWTKKGLN